MLCTGTGRQRTCRILLLVRAGCLLGWYVPNQDTTVLDSCDPFFKPFSKLFVSFNLRCHEAPFGLSACCSIPK